jgi:hypothetical protein
LQPVEGCCSKKSSTGPAHGTCLVGPVMQPGFSRTCAPRGRPAWGAEKQPVEGCCSKKSSAGPVRRKCLVRPVYAARLEPGVRAAGAGVNNFLGLRSKPRRRKTAWLRKDAGPAWMPAWGIFPWVCEANPQPKIATEGGLRPKGGAMEGAVSIAIRHRRIDGFGLWQNPRPKTGMEAGFWPAQGIGAEIPEAPRPISAREACRLRTNAARRSAGICQGPEKKRRGLSRAGARLGG